MSSQSLRLIIGTFLCATLASNALPRDGSGLIEFRVIVPQSLPWHLFPNVPAYLVIQSSAEWIAYWSVPGRLSRPIPIGQPSDPTAHAPPSDVDFDRFTLLVVSTGPKGSLGYAVSISSIIREEARGIVVSVLDVGPGGNQCAVMSMLSYPMVFALIPKTEESIRFQISEVKTDCNNRPRTIGGKNR
jgi:hypothetical protein